MIGTVPLEHPAGRAFDPATAPSSLAKACELEDVAEREVYGALDWLLDQQLRIEAALAKKHLKGGALVLYDVSSSYLEGHCCELAHHGYSRDHRPDRPQIVYGLLCAADGAPVAIEVFEGNTSDPKTLTAQVETLRRRSKLAHIVLVGDRGMITSARIAEDLKPAGLDWISCLKAPQIWDLVAAGPLQLSLFDERDLAEISAPELFPGERLIACRNPLLAGERARKRNALLEATERNLRRIAEAVRRAPKKHTAAVIGLKVDAVIDKRRMAKHFVLDIVMAMSRSAVTMRKSRPRPRSTASMSSAPACPMTGFPPKPRLVPTRVWRRWNAPSAR